MFDELNEILVERFTDVVMRSAGLPEARRTDVRDSAIFMFEKSRLACTCTITGCAYEEDWNGTEEQAKAFADEVGENTAWLLNKTRHYAWLRAGR